MNIASDVYNAVIRPFSTRRSNSIPIEQLKTEGDIEEDGFLVVEETESERNTIYARTFSNKIDSPPGYNESHLNSTKENQDLPSYMDYMQTSPKAMNGMGVTPQTGPHGSYNTIPLTNNSAVTGIQFKMAPQIQAMIDTCGINDHVIRGRHSITDVSKYFYDFSLEEKVLRDAQNMGLQ